MQSSSPATKLTTVLSLMQTFAVKTSYTLHHFAMCIVEASLPPLYTTARIFYDTIFERLCLTHLK